VDGHLKTRPDRNPIHHLVATVRKPRHQWGFAATITLATGGFMLMPFGSAFSVHNLGVPLTTLPMVYMATGLASMFSGPLIGRLSDAVGKYRTFAAASALAITVVLYYTRLGVTPIAVVIAINILMFTAVSGRMISSSALSSAIPAPQDRGAYMSISSSLQQLAGGVASSCAGLLVSQSGNGPLEHYERLGYVVALSMTVGVILMGKIDTIVRGDAKARPTVGAILATPAAELPHD
jgi:predicted MFS family arabinose efflux permease